MLYREAPFSSWNVRFCISFVTLYCIFSFSWNIIVNRQEGNDGELLDELRDRDRIEAPTVWEPANLYRNILSDAIRN